MVSEHAETVLQWLERKTALNCGQCRQNRWDRDRIERVAVIPFSNLPSRPASGGPAVSRRGSAERAAGREAGSDLREAAREHTAFQVICQHCGNTLLIDEQVMNTGG